MLISVDFLIIEGYITRFIAIRMQHYPVYYEIKLQMYM